MYAPAEEVPHARTWMCWPSTPTIYGGEGVYYDDVQATIGRLAAAIAEHEPVTVLAGKTLHATARAACGFKVELLDVATDDMWSRDAGPIFLNSANGTKAVLDLNFNGWGGKQDHARDRSASAAIGAGARRPASSLESSARAVGIEGSTAKARRCQREAALGGRQP